METEVTSQVVDLSAPPSAAAPAPVVPVPGFTGEPGNFTKDMAALQAELTPAPVVEAAPAVEEVAPEITDSATAPVTPPVPDKFKDAEGKLDTAKLDKSQQAAEDEIARVNKYLETQKELRRKQNEASGFKNAPPIVPGEAAAPNSFAAQIEADVKQFGLGPVMAHLFESAKEVAKAEAKKDVLADVNADREERKANKDRRELEDIAKYDREVLTPEGLDSLARIRAERPYLETLANPTMEAYDIYLAQKVKKARQTGTVLPNPTGVTARATPAPVPLAPRVVVKPAEPDLSTRESLDRHLASLDDKGKDEFFRKRGFKV